MQDTINTLEEIENKFVEIVQKILKIDVSKKKNYGKVRVAWPTNGAPDWKINEDICFIRITPVDSPSARQQDILYDANEENEDALKEEIAYTRVHNINFCLYGPNSYNNADLIRFALMKESIRKEINNINLHLITDIPMPIRVPELFNGQWWDRTDFNVTYNELVVRRSEANKLILGDIKLLSNK